MTRRITLQPAGNVFEVGQGEAILAAADRAGLPADVITEVGRVEAGMFN